MGEGQDVGLGDEGDLALKALAAIAAALRPRNVPERGAAACPLERESDRALDPRARVDRRLDRHFLGRALAREPPAPT